MSAGEEKLEFQERGNAALWGAHAARVLVLAARQNNLLCQESSRPAKAFGVASTPVACAPQNCCCAPDPRSFASRLRRARRRSRGRCRRCAEIEIHGRCSFRARLRGEEWPRRKTKHPGDKIRRKAAHGRVVILHRNVEVAALDRNTVLRAFDLRLQAEKALIRL